MGILNSQQKQYINLSRYACETISSDLQRFEMDLTIPKMMNRILDHYMDHAQANIDQSADAYRTLLINDIQSGNRKLLKGALPYVDVLVDQYTDRLREKALSYPNGQSFHIYLSNGNCKKIFGPSYQFLHESELEFLNAEYYGKLCFYLKAVIEEFCSLHAYERERILFSETFDMVAGCIERRMDLKVHTNGSSSFRLTPYRICTDNEKMHYYIVGESRMEDKDVIPVSLRLSRLNIDHIYKTGYVLPAMTRKELDRKISDGNIRFLSGDVLDITAILTENGKRRLASIQHLRPPYHISGQGEYHFRCTAFQAYSYFSQFGSDIEILGPDHIREHLKNFYKNALEKYGSQN